MRIAVSIKGGSGSMFGGSNSSTDVTLDAIADYEVGAATVAVLNILAAHGIGAEPVGDGDDESVGTVAESDEKVDPRNSPAAPGDAVRITFEDESSRLYIDCGNSYESPVVVGLFDERSILMYGDPSIASITVVETLGDSLGGR